MLIAYFIHDNHYNQIMRESIIKVGRKMLHQARNTRRNRELILCKSSD